MHATRYVFLATATTLLILAFPAASAVPGVMGSQVLAGESDWIIPAKGSSRPFNVIYADLGQSGDPRDDCAILRTTASSTATHADFTTSTTQSPKTKDLRLTPCHGGPAGTAITDQSIVELRTTWTFDPDLHAVYADINANAKYDKTDLLYLTTKTATGTAANAM